MNKVRILHVIGQIRRGGCESQLLGLCQRMDKDRYELSICWYSREEEELGDEFARAGVRTFFFDKFSMPIWTFFRRLRGVVKEVGPDVVHTWMYSANFWGRWAALTCSVPHLVASDRNVIWQSGRIERLSERLLAGRTLRLANSQAIAQSLEKHFCLPVERTRVVYNAVSLPAVDREEARRSVRQELALPADNKLVLMVGRLMWPKNYAMFVRTAGRVCGQRGDVVFLAAGTGPDESDLRAQVESAALAQRVRFLGFRADVPRLLAAADVFCFTSLSEGFPNAVLEAMFTGLPVVCTSFPSMSELLTDCEQAILVPLDDDAAMASQIVALLDDPDRCRRMGASARAYVRSRYTWDRTVVSMGAVYDELMPNRP